MDADTLRELALKHLAARRATQQRQTRWYHTHKSAIAARRKSQRAAAAVARREARDARKRLNNDNKVARTLARQARVADGKAYLACSDSLQLGTTTRVPMPTILAHDVITAESN